MIICAVQDKVVVQVLFLRHHLILMSGAFKVFGILDRTRNIFLFTLCFIE